MRDVYENVLECIGNTPIVKLNHLTRGLKANVYVKLEFMNPGGSVKDRMAVRMVDDAERSGALKPGGVIVEATSGNTGAGLAMTAAVRGYTCVFVLPDKQSEEKRAALRAYGARVVVTPTNVDADDPRSYYKVSRKIADDTPNAFYANQYHNPSNWQAHYDSTGPELWDQMGDQLHVFIAGLGTGGTVTGTSKYLKERNPKMRTVGVDPVGSLYYDYFRTGQLTEPFSYLIEGIGEDFLPSTMNFEYVDDVVRVADKEGFQMTRRLCREEGIFAGVSSGTAVAGALKWVRANDREGLNVVIVLPDGGSKYLSKVYNDQWMAESGMLEEPPTLGSVADILETNGNRKPIVVDEKVTVIDAIRLLKEHGISQVPVMRGDRIAGVLHETNLLEAALGPKTSTAGSLATMDFCVVDRNTDVTVLSDLLRRSRVALVMENEQLIGVVTRIDLIDHVARKTGA
ncbi:MAG: pyridoxal-phosphate dependent enzyme [Myxococcales bacterium]|nr:pyridoxal-phosphate dependent enzyme [Myxococcales bacterium]